MQGKIIKGIAGFYYVHVVESGIYECKAKGIFRKDGIKPLVGDNVEIEILDEKDMEGNITKILPRKNELVRPAVANIDQALVVFAVTKPKPHFNLLDRFLVMMESKDIPAVLCFNKTDIAEDPDIAGLKEIYGKCGYPLVFTSAKKENNIKELKSLLGGRTTAIAGPSGVGKSSLINLLQSGVTMETGSISHKIERGKHTTRHSELIVLEEGSYVDHGDASFTLFGAWADGTPRSFLIEPKKDGAFRLLLPAWNGGKPILLARVGDTPFSIGTVYGDEAQYRAKYMQPAA